VVEVANEKVIKEKPTDPRFKDWGRLGRWETAGWRLVEADEGPRSDKLKRRQYMVVDRPWDVMYNHSYGRVSPFFLGLLEKKLMGTRCPKCGDTFCPPRAHCWRTECHIQETEWIEMPLKGTLHSYAIMGFAGEAFLDDLPFILAYVRPDGSNTMIAARMTGIAPEDVECDTRVRIKFVDEPKGNVMDIYFVPDGKPAHSKSEQEKARIREKFGPIVEWVAKRKAARAQPAPKAEPKASPPKPGGRPRRKAAKPKAPKRVAGKRVVRKKKQKTRPRRNRAAAKRAPTRARRGRPPKRGRPKKKKGGRKR
jgi:hypothetical protein